MAKKARIPRRTYLENRHIDFVLSNLWVGFLIGLSSHRLLGVLVDQQNKCPSEKPLDYVSTSKHS